MERISIELTNKCQKGCWFCYNHSSPAGNTSWSVPELVNFVTDCADHDVRAVSFGGGEPLQFDGLFELLTGLRGLIFRSMTTNGLLLNAQMIDRLAEAQPDKVHISIHFPERSAEVRRVIRQVHELSDRGIKSGINLLVAQSMLDAARTAAEIVRQEGIENERIVYLPMRGQDTPTPREIAVVAGGQPFQSMSCLGGCAKSPRFCSIARDRSVAWCSYTIARRKLERLTYEGLMVALNGLDLQFCGGTNEA
ncbi:MAG TPA: radical SAM protein [Tepidisphaeraceae bacterium]|nr:radical SAM protein [Tepidisphaeraceae bacterium]